MELLDSSKAQTEHKVFLAPRGKTLKNAIFRFGGQISAIAINLAITPYIIHHLGVELFGVVGVITAIVSFMSIASSSLTSTVGRNLTLAVEKRDFSRADSEISTSVFGVLAILGVVLFPMLAGSIFIDRLINIPPTALWDARILFLLSIGSFSLTLLAGPLGAAMFVRNRLDLFSGVNLAKTVVFVIVVLLLFHFQDASLITYGLALLSGSILFCLANIAAHKYLLPGVHIASRWFSLTVLRESISLGGWMTVSQIGALLFLQTDIFVANRVLGAETAGQYAAIIVISAQLRVLAGLASGLFAPTQTALWAQDNMAAFESYLIRSIRLTTMMMALFVGVFCGTAKVVLSLWLSPKFGTLAPTAVMLTWYLVPTLGIMPIWNALLAAGKVKIPALITLAMGAGNVVLSIVLAKYMGLMGIALACCITLVLKNAVWTPWYTSRVCNINTLRLWRELALGTIFGALIALLSYGATTILGPQTKFMLFVTLSLSTCLGLIIAAPMIFRELLRMRPKYSASRR